MRRNWLCLMIGASLAATLFALAAGCGIKSAPVPPETIRPQAIEDLHAVSQADGIELFWTRPERYTGGSRMRDLGQFELFRSLDGGPPVKLAQLPITDRMRFQQQRRFAYLDADTKLGQRYHYSIVSFTTDGYESPPSNQVTITRVRPRPTPNPETYVLPTPSLP